MVACRPGMAVSGPIRNQRSEHEFARCPNVQNVRTPPRHPDGRQSHVAGVTQPPLIEHTIPALLKQTAARFRDRPAVVFCARKERWTWAEFDRKCDAVADGFLRLGLKKGDRIGIWGPNSPEWLLTMYASARIGLILVNVNPAYRPFELEYALNKSGCRALVLAEQFKTSNYVEMLQGLAPELKSCPAGALRAARVPKLEMCIKMGAAPAPGMLLFDGLMSPDGKIDTASLDAITATLSQNDPINIQFTSGTTGAPKGATLTHRNIVNNGFFTVSAIKFSEADRLCITVPLYHCFGMVMGTLGCVSVGACMVFPGEGFDPVATLEAVDAERCTALYGVPSMFALILDAKTFGDYDISSLRTGVMAGAPCPIELMRKVIARMHMGEITICYGMTETSPVSFQSDVDDPLERRVSTIGRVHPHVEVRIVDTAGHTVPVGVAGEICTRGYSVMLGYWDDEARTRDAVVDGWMHTGDLGVIDADGYGSVVGRLKDMVIRGGENIYPREIEEFLVGHEAIRDVQVFGVPDERFGEELCAWIVVREGRTLTEAELRSYCQDRIAHFKIPRYFRFRDELPMTATGKAQKFKMREEMIAEIKGKK